MTRTLTYDTDGLHPVSESVALEEDALTWTMTWDRVLGVATTLRAPDGHQLVAGYDDLGRLASVALDDQTPHRVVEYLWSAPSPRTVVWDFDGGADDLTAWTGLWTAAGRWRQTVEMANGRGEVRYRAVRRAEDEWIISDYKERDPSSRVVFTGRPVYAAGLEHTQRPAGLVGTELRYDPLGRLIEQELPTGTKRLFSYTAFERTMQEDGLAPVHTVFDGRGRVVATDRSLSDGTVEALEARYDAADRLIEISLQDGLVSHLFEYDSLGRLVSASDPDIGPRELTYDDGNRLETSTNGAGQTISYRHDAAGRLVEERAGDGTTFVYHYDAARPDEPTANVRARLAWVEEPTGYAAFGYDALGRTARRVRTIDGSRLDQSTVRSPSGLVLGHSDADGFAVDFTYDPAGRVIGAGPFWTLEEQDAAGSILRERYGNGVVQRTERDLLGLVTDVVVERSDGTRLYDVDVDRNDWLALDTVTDNDGRGLDHTASFGYDSQGRLTEATVGQGAAAHQFAYDYDVLQNMTARQATGPRALAILAGEHRYGEGGRGPRQLTSIHPATGAPVLLDYDAAGRLRSQGGLTLEYDGLDQLVRVQGLSSGSGQVQHAYGHDRARTRTIAPDGAVTYWFSEDTVQRGGVRERVVSVGDRAVARVTGAPAGSAAGHRAGRALPPPVERSVRPGVAAGMALFGALLLLLVTAARSRTARRVAAGAAALAIAQLSCISFDRGETRHAVWETHEVLYIHHGLSAGPTLFTREDQSIAAERRFEPFGAAIDSLVETEDGPIVGDVDFAAIDHNSLAKRTDPATGWSYHGARWMAPETARWLTPDPPIKAPDPEHLADPASLHPYQYVRQNPVLFWDPDGRDQAAINWMANLPGPCMGCPDYKTLRWAAENQRQPPPAPMPGGGMTLDDVQLGLDAASMVDQTPLTNLASAGVSVLRGDWKGAGLSVVAAVLTITVVGDEAIEGLKVSRGIADRADDGVRLVNGRRPINSRYAGQTHPSGVRFTANGFPDFSPYAKARTQLKGLTGDYPVDAAMANKAVGLRATPEDMVWHHVEDGVTMLLIPRKVHDAARHTGGAAVIRGQQP